MMPDFFFRSLLFMPGSRHDILAKASATAADALILDLEDSVAPNAREEARLAVAAVVAEDGPPTFVRVNHPSTGEMGADLAATVGGRIYGIVLPKAESPDEVAELVDSLTALERDRDLRRAPLRILPLVETCLGIRHVYEMARVSDRVCGMAFSSGEDGDFMADLGGRWTPAGEAMLYPRSKLVCDTRAAGLDVVVDGVFMSLDDDGALATECSLARTLGFTAKMAIHPSQLAVIHQAFTPAADDVAQSRELIETYRTAREAGIGAVRYRGKMIDEANVKRALRIIASAGPES